MNTKQLEGKIGEIEATKYLENLEYEILCNNFRCMQGEIDIIARDGREIVFIEVKTRTNTRFGEAREAVDENKKKHILNAAKYFLYKKNLQDSFTRVDVIEVYIKDDIKIINHLKQVI